MSYVPSTAEVRRVLNTLRPDGVHASGAELGLVFIRGERYESKLGWMSAFTNITCVVELSSPGHGTLLITEKFQGCQFTPDMRDAVMRQAYQEISVLQGKPFTQTPVKMLHLRVD